MSVDLGQLQFAHLYEGGPEAKFSDEQLRFDPWLSCRRNMLKDYQVTDEIDKADELARLLSDDHRIITNEVNNKCVFVNGDMTPVLDGQIFRVGTYSEIDDHKAQWTWELKHRAQFTAFGGLVELKKFAQQDSSVLDCAELMQLLRICAITIDCNYVDLRGGVGYFIRNLHLSSGLCICGKIGGMQCSKCKKNYCSKTCQRLDWPKHKNDCKNCKN